MAVETQQIWQKRGWRKAIAILCITYCMLIWVLPIVIAVVFTELPYLQKRSFFDRLLLSAIGSFALIVAMFTCFPERFSVYRSSTPLKTAKNWILGILGLVMFTVFGAAWSANLFGAIVKLTPGLSYSDQFMVTDVDFRGVRHKAALLSLKSKKGTKDFYLALSERLFDDHSIRAGDEVVLEGKQNAFGIYIESFRLMESKELRHLILDRE